MNKFEVMITVGSSCYKARRVIREYGGCRLCHDIGELISFNLVPDIKD